MPKQASRVASALAVVSLQAACGGDVQRSAPGPSAGGAGSPGQSAGTQARTTPSAEKPAVPARGAASGQDAATPDPCAPENRPICGTLRERVVYVDSGECVIYVPHAAGDPRPFDPNVLAIQVGTAGGPRKLTYVTDATGCSAGNTRWRARLVFHRDSAAAGLLPGHLQRDPSRGVRRRRDAGGLCVGVPAALTSKHRVSRVLRLKTAP